MSSDKLSDVWCRMILDGPPEQIVLDKLRIAVEEVMNLEGLYFVRNHAELEARLDHLSRHLVMRLTSFLLAGKEYRSVGQTVGVPADWWQAFRERWLPGWWLRRYPVKMCWVTETVVVRRVCPHVNVKTTPEPHVTWLINH